jgi:hypothetical protein
MRGAVSLSVPETKQPQPPDTMKKYTLHFVALIAVGLLALTYLSGCQSTPVVVRPASTNYVDQVVTNYTSVTNYVTNVVEIAAATTNANTGEVTPALLQPQILPTVTLAPKVVTNVVEIRTPPITYDQLSLSPLVPVAAQIAAEVSPVPWAAAGAGVFSAIASAVVSFVNRRRKLEAEAQAANAQSKSATLQAAAEVLVQNMEQIRTAAIGLPGYTPELDTKIVRAWEAAQRGAGANVKELIAAIVAEKTDTTIPDNFYTKK